MAEDFRAHSPRQKAVVRTIVRWQHGGKHAAHCLARMYTPPNISDDFANVADSFLQALPPTTKVSPALVVWLAHHGTFSYYDPTGEETFTKIGLRWDGHHYRDDLTEHRLLDAPEVNALLGGFEPDPVPAELDALRSR